ncbi:MAG: T9SS type A sorting domain-containing protein [Candidatus Cloacimonetes bacterium]|nr:T9SS type A sorting domain-containing protein [Candidatus Cloacimonadota bacterium]
MRTKIVLFILIIFVYLFSQFNEPIHINEEYPFVKFSGQQGFKIINETAYLAYRQITYGQEFIIFSKKTNNDLITHTVVDTLHEFFSRFSEPVLDILPNGNILVVYTKEMPPNYSLLTRAISTDDGETFEKMDIAIDAFGKPVVVCHNDIIGICYSKKYVTRPNRSSLAEYQHYTEIEETENADGGTTAARVKFWGGDELFGPVHSNSDIWIHQQDPPGGGVGNDGWPIFWGMVTTSGIFRKHPSGTPLVQSGAPMDQIFRYEPPPGWEEEVFPLIHNGADLIYANGIPLGGPDTDIVYVKLSGGSFECMYGQIVETGVDTFYVYSWFPHNADAANAVINAGGNWYEDSDHIYTNYITMYDTIWTVGPSFPVNDASVWIEHGELWIEGEVYGAQTWGCSDTVYIVGDITYANTLPGEPPDDPDNPNTTDYFGLVSETRIYIRYKHRDPFENLELVTQNCCNIMIYGAYAALGVGDTLVYGELACHYDGIFTPEYQHPHGSTPSFIALSPFTLQETLYTFVDLHKYIFPLSAFVPPNIEGFNLHGNFPAGPNMTCGYPYESPEYIASYPNNNPSDYVYPYGTDYPWLNPVWPESSENIVFERGTIYIWGSLAQTRRGYIHRSGSDFYNHPNNYEWDLENFHYDGSHGSTGYVKDYYYDTRFHYIQPPDYPTVSTSYPVEEGLVIMRSIDGGQFFTTVYDEQYDHDIIAKSMDSDDEKIVIAYQLEQVAMNFNFLISEDDGLTFTEYEVSNFGYILRNVKIQEDELFVLASTSQQDVVLKYDIGSTTPQIIGVFSSPEHLSDFSMANSGSKVYVNANDPINIQPLEFDFSYTTIYPEVFTENYTWQTSFEDFDPYLSNVAIIFNEFDSVYVSFLKAYPNMEELGELYLASGHLESLVETTENEIVRPKYTLSIYPNPFNPSTTIFFNISRKDAKYAKIIIYNIKGQKVKTLNIENCKLNIGQVVWNGTDDSGKYVSSGVYFCRLKVNGKSEIVKKMLLLR